MNSIFIIAEDQVSPYVKVNVDDGIIRIPSGLTGFRHTYVKIENVVRNEGARQNPYIHKTQEYHLTGFYKEADELRICSKC